MNALTFFIRGKNHRDRNALSNLFIFGAMVNGERFERMTSRVLEAAAAVA